MWGAHFSTAPGEVDDGTPISFVGTAIGPAAVVAVTSARDGSTYLVLLNRVGKRIDWLVTETIEDGTGEDSALLPAKANLASENAPAEMEEGAAECDAHFDEGY